MESSRENFTSSFGFIMAAAGSAVGLGNVWAFPTAAAENGGAVFVIIYLIFAFVVGYPVLLVEFTLGRYTRSNPVGVYQKIKGGKPFVPMGFLALIGIGLILSFYSLIAGSVFAYFIEPIFRVSRNNQVAVWITSQNTYSRILFASVFFVLTVFIVIRGVREGIEKWSKRLMPSLLIMLVLLIAYVFTLEGAMEGVRKYLLPDFGKALNPEIFANCMGQAFFSLSLGIGSMLVYASYTTSSENLVKLGMLVTLCDVCIAFLAGLLIIPAMYAAAFSGTAIFDDSSHLISGPNLIFQVLPSLFGTMGYMGIFISLVFFFLMTIAALTSTISMLEVPVSYVMEKTNMNRLKAGIAVGFLCWLVSVIIALNFERLFGLALVVSTQWIQPLSGLAMCIFAGWIMHRNRLIREIAQGNPNFKSSVLFRVWPFFVKVISPALILVVFLHMILSS